MNILQTIFKDHYEEMLYILHPRQAVIDNVDKMINCGVKYCQDRSNAMAFKLIQCTHRHCVFTIDEELRLFFLKDRSLLDCLFHAVRSVVLRMFFLLNKSKNFVPGFICVLHTFGRLLEWNPHIHCLITESGFSDDGFWRVVKHFNYTLLRKSFQTALHYNRHEDNAFVKKTIPALDFISLLIQHIPEPQYKMTRYYGLYARHRSCFFWLRPSLLPQLQSCHDTD